MESVRLIIRLLGIVVTTLLLYSIYLLMSLFLLGSRKARLKLGNRMQSLWAGLICRMIGMKIYLQGPRPEPPFLLVTNHLGYMDILLLAACLRTVFVSKKEVKNWPFIGFMAASIGTIFIDRASKREILEVNHAIEQAILDGYGIVVFAEGTSSGGDQVLPLKPSLLNVATQLSIAVNAGAIHYQTPPGQPPAKESICWWGDMTFGAHFLNLLRLPNFSAHLSFSPDKIAGSDRKKLAQELHTNINRQHLALTG